MALLDLAIFVHEEISAVAVQDTGPSARKRCRMLLVKPVARRLDAKKLDRQIVEKGMEKPDGIRAAADRGKERIRRPSFGGEHLSAGFFADHTLKIPHHRSVRMRARGRPDEIKSVPNIGDPVAQRLVHRVLERLGAALNRHDLSAEQIHAKDVWLLSLDIDRAHVNHAFKAKARAGRCGRNPMLACPGLGDDSRLPHPAGEEYLAKHIVNLMGASVVELLALEVDLGTAGFPGRSRPLAHVTGKARGIIERRGPACVMSEKIVKLRLECGV